MESAPTGAAAQGKKKTPGRNLIPPRRFLHLKLGLQPQLFGDEVVHGGEGVVQLADVFAAAPRDETIARGSREIKHPRAE